MLKDYPKEIILKDGTGLTLRPLREGDKTLLSQMYGRFSETDKWFLDFDMEDSHLIENWIADVDPEKRISIVALLEGKIIGHTTLIRKYHGARSHIGKIRVSVDPDFRERHLGTWMLLDIVNLSMALGLEMVVMSMVENKDSAAMGGIEKLDFYKFAELKDYLKDMEGNNHNLVIFGKRLYPEWEPDCNL